MIKKNQAKHSEAGPSCAYLEFNHRCAREVFIAGSFNNWNRSATPMIALADGKWSKELRLPPGRYEYRFIVDGQWIDDPAAKETVPNAFGGVNAVLAVVNSAGNAVSRPATAKLRSSRRSE